MKKNIVLLVIIIIVIVMGLFLGCDKSSEFDNNFITEDFFALGTIIQIKVFDVDTQKAKKAIDESIARVTEIENKMTINKDDSEVIEINSNAGENGVQVSYDTFYVIKKAGEYGRFSEGAFDLTIEPIVKLWGIGTKQARIPKDEEIISTLSLVNYKDVMLDETNNSVKLEKKGQAIDLGAIAKGYAGDEIKRILMDNGITTAFINLGGNVVTLGNKLDGTSWKIGIQNPVEKRGNHIAVIEVIDKTVVTSGNYERYFIEDGKRYHHIINPKTGYPAEEGVISSTIVADSSIDADALSTAVYVMGLDKGLDFIENMDKVEAAIITKDNKIYITSGLRENIKISNPQFTLVEQSLIKGE